VIFGSEALAVTDGDPCALIGCFLPASVSPRSAVVLRAPDQEVPFTLRYPACGFVSTVRRLLVSFTLPSAIDCGCNPGTKTDNKGRIQPKDILHAGRRKKSNTTVIRTTPLRSAPLPLTLPFTADRPTFVWLFPRFTLYGTTSSYIAPPALSPLRCI
jgi:hypothetical protein